MANKFLNGIDTTSLSVNSQYSLPTSDGSNKQVLTTDGNGNVTFSDVDLVGAQAHYVYYEVKNSTGATIPKGTAVRAVGTDGNSGHILVSAMVADGSVEPKYFIGITADAIGNGQTGSVIHFGMLTGFDTSGFTDGDVLWCDPASDGNFTTTEPAGPNLKLAVAFVVSAAINGKIFIRVQGNEGLHELHDVNISSQANGDLLQWNATSGVWENKTLASIADSRYVNVSGDTMTGPLTVNTGTSNAVTEGITLNRPSAGTNYHGFILATNGTVDWSVGQNSNDSFEVYENGSAATTRFTIKEGGNVGFNVTSPLANTNNDGIHIDRGGHTTIQIGDGLNDGGVIQSSDNTRRLFIGANIYDDVTNSWSHFDDTKPYAAFDAIANNEARARILVGRPDETGYGSDNIFFEAFKSNSDSYIKMRTHSTDNAMYIKDSGAIGIGTSTPEAKLQVEGSLKVVGGIYVQNSTDHGAVLVPEGGYYRASSADNTGAIKITLPTHGTADMVGFTVDIYDYTTDESVTVFIKGYLYQTTTNNEWVSPSAQIIATRTDREYTVRFGADGTNNCVWIGETDSTWAWLQVQVRDFFGGFNTDIDAYDNGWSVEVVTAFDTVDETLTNTFPQARNADTVDGLQASQFLRSDANDTMSGELNMNGNKIILGLNDFIQGDYTNYQSGLFLNSGQDVAIRTNSNDAGVDYFYLLDSSSDTVNLKVKGDDGETYMRGSLGLGITPTKKLHVYSSGNEVAFLQGTSGGAWLDIQSSTSKLWSLGAVNADAFGIYNRTDGAYAMQIKNTGDTFIQGKLAIGNNQRHDIGSFYVSDDVGADNVLVRFRNTNNGFPSTLRFQADNTSGTSKYADIEFDPDLEQLILRNPYSASSPSLQVESNGNIGINTNVAYGQLTLTHTGNNTAGTYYGNLILNSTDANTWSRIRWDKNGVERFGIALNPDQKLAISNLYTGGTAADPDDAVMVIDGASNIGFGNASPKTKVHIHTSGTLPASGAIQSGSNLAVSGVDGNMDLLSYDDNTTVSNSLAFGRYSQTDGSLIHKFSLVTWAETGSGGSNAGDRLSIHYGTNRDGWNNSELVSFKRTGKVGINNSDPAERLDVEGTVRCTDIRVESAANSSIRIGDGFGSGGTATIHNYNQDLYLQYNNGQTATTVYYGGGGTATRIADAQNSNYLLASVSNQDSYIAKHADQKLGVGTASPTKKLHVSTSGNEGIFLQGSSVGVWMDIQSSTSDLWSIGADGSGWSVYNRTDGEYRLSIAPDSNVTTLHNGVLRVTSNGSSAGYFDAGPTYGAFRFYDGSTFRGGIGTGSWAATGASTDIVAYLTGNNFIVTNNQSNEFARFDGPNKRVGILTTAPSSELDVNGNIERRGSQINPATIKRGHQEYQLVYSWNVSEGAIGSGTDVRTNTNPLGSGEVTAMGRNTSGTGQITLPNDRKYRKVYGYFRIRAQGSMDGFNNSSATIDQTFVDGVVLSGKDSSNANHTHIWTVAVNCYNANVFLNDKPSFVGDNYQSFLTAHTSGNASYWDYWLNFNDGSGNSPVQTFYFEREIPSSLDGDLFVRIMSDQATSNEDVGLESFAIYVAEDTPKVHIAASNTGVTYGRDWHINNRVGLRLDSRNTSSPSDILFGHNPLANDTDWNNVYWALSSRAASEDNKFSIWRGSGNPTGGTEYRLMTFDPNLRVGIKNNSPVATLDVDGSFAITGAADLARINFETGGYHGIRFRDDSGNNKWKWGHGKSDGQFYLYDYTRNDSIIQFNPNGTIYFKAPNVGIGTNTAAHGLHVYKDQNQVACFESPNANTWIDIKSTSGTWSLGSGSGDYLGIYQRGSVNATKMAMYNTNVRFYTSMSVASSSAPSYALDVTGTIRATADVIAYSDVRLKENIKTIDNALDKVQNLRGVEFNKKDETKKSIGVIAQEIEQILPEVVHEDEKGMKSVAYGNIVGVLIEAIKEQQKQIDELKAMINGDA